MQTRTSTLLPFLCFLCSISPSTAVTGTEVPVNGFPSPWGSGGPDGWDEAYEKAREFVSGLTLVEKVNLTTGTGWESDVCVGMTGSIPRLGFRGLCTQDGPLGVRYTEGNSAFPAGINVAATFSRDLMRRRGIAMGEEFRGKGIDVQLGPVAGPLGRVPAGGRNWEGFSPDPYLTGVAMAETVQGIQSRGVVACAKHYILNEQEHFRNSMDARVDDRTMHEVYLWPFADAVKAGVGSLMCSYNKINGSWSCENEWTTNYLLKNELNFQGFVMSDWGAQHTGPLSALAGLDMTMSGDGGPPPYRSYWGGALTEAVLNGTVPIWRLDDMVVRIMAAYFKVHVGNYTDRPEINFSSWTKNTTGPLHPSSNSSWTVVNQRVDVQRDHGALIREIGAKSIVLLKNTNSALPLRKPASVAVIGEDAQDTPGGPNACPERGCDKGTLAMAWGSGTAEFPYLVSPASALEHQAALDGTSFTNISSNADIPGAVAAARMAEVAIVFGNADAGENFITLAGNAGDRNNLTLWLGAEELMRAVAAVNNNTIIVLHTVGPVIIEWARQHPNVSAILWAGLPGQESGNALVDVLYGAVNPQGRSPFTWGKREADWGPMQVDYTVPNPRMPAQVFEEGVFIDYRYFMRQGIEPSYEFGFGMSYTRFLYSNLSIVAQNGTTYKPASGKTIPAPTYGEVNTTLEANVVPEGFQRITPYIYPWVNETSFRLGYGDGSVGPAAASDGSAQLLLPAGGAPGGNPGLYDVVYTVSFAINNTGPVFGTEISQLYLQLGGKENPFGVLRGFDEVSLAPGEIKTVVFNVTRRDISNWNSASQNWEVNSEDKFLFIGGSSRLFNLNATLPKFW
ncbi:glycoside hydrolase family 3 protein [Coniochaeta ligniaria NRRL 30616]|uniref:beta-glucosidase n=1 Tax=Coniochaeta ligniaria NRRL 30616 TaxID=1408157 RepID=A0A1J7IH11_9PEZI|nr:glycoside hydrolase family 3 protein [Coniochaeta ligniaria NRRL 30616]